MSPAERGPAVPVDEGRRWFLKTIIVGGIAAAAAHELHLGPFADHDKTDVPHEFDGQLSLDNIDEIKDRAAELAKHSEQELAAYLLESKHVSFDEEYPRIKESMLWARKEAVFPLVDPKGDIDKGLDHASPNVPVQKPLLVLLSLMSDAGIDYEITSLATSSEHGEGSHHYQGRGCDIHQGESTLEIMKFVNAMHAHKIVAMDELFAPGNPQGLGLNDGAPGAGNEGNHIHLSTKALENPRERYLDPTEAEVFVDDKAAHVAKQLGVTPATYFNIDADSATKLRKETGGFAGSEEVVQGVFPPSVMHWKEHIEAAAERTGLPANFIATLVTIESCGNQRAASGADAHGLIQVVPHYHRERIDRISGKRFKEGEAGDADRAQYLKDHPAKSLMIGADFLKELVAAAREVRPDLDPEDPVIYMRAAAGYNGGQGNIDAGFSHWPLESKLYAVYVSAFYADVCMAIGLKKAGVNSDDIAEALKSPAMTERMRAFREFGRKSTYDDYSRAYRRLEVPHPGVKDDKIVDIQTRTLVRLMAAGYDKYSNRGGEVIAGMPPALTFWTAHGGFGTLRASAANNEWLHRLAG